MPERSTEAEVSQRIEAVFKLLIDGKRPVEIIRFASENGWKVGDRQVENYIARANRLIEDQSATVRSREVGRAITRLTAWLAKAHELGDIKLSLEIQKELNKLLGLYEPTRTEITGQDGGAIVVKAYTSITPDDWNAPDEPAPDRAV